MRLRLLTICLISTLLVDVAHAELDIIITEGIKRRPIAVVPFGWSGRTPEMPVDVSQIMSDDLDRSGRFAPVPEENMLQKPTSGAELDFDDWSILGVEDVVDERVQLEARQGHGKQDEHKDWDDDRGLGPPVTQSLGDGDGTFGDVILDQRVILGGVTDLGALAEADAGGPVVVASMTRLTAVRGGRYALGLMLVDELLEPQPHLVVAGRGP